MICIYFDSLNIFSEMLKRLKNVITNVTKLEMPVLYVYCQFRECPVKANFLGTNNANNV
jgi:hypothetical protein